MLRIQNKKPLETKEIDNGNKTIIIILKAWHFLGFNPNEHEKEIAFLHFTACDRSSNFTLPQLQ